MLQQFPSVQVKDTYFYITQLQKPCEPFSHKACTPKTSYFTTEISGFQLQLSQLIWLYRLLFTYTQKNDAQRTLSFFIYIVSVLLTTRAQNKHFPKQRYFPNPSKAFYFFKAILHKVTAISYIRKRLQWFRKQGLRHQSDQTPPTLEDKAEAEEKTYKRHI